MNIMDEYEIPPEVLREAVVNAIVRIIKEAKKIEQWGRGGNTDISL